MKAIEGEAVVKAGGGGECEPQRYKQEGAIAPDHPYYSLLLLSRVILLLFSSETVITQTTLPVLNYHTPSLVIHTSRERNHIAFVNPTN